MDSTFAFHYFQRMKIFPKIIFALSLSILSSALAQNLTQATVKAQYEGILNGAPNSKDFLTPPERQKLFEHVSKHPVASLRETDKYDIQPTGIGNGEIGFCFGRAMAVHLAARRMGLKEENIQKIFIAGDLRNGNIRWRFHMATLVKGEDRQWYVVDPIMPSLQKPGVLLPKEWMDAVKNTFDLADGRDDSKFYLANTQAIMADMSVVPATPAIEAESIVEERLINTTFDPRNRADFDLVPQNEISTAFDLYRVSGAAQNKYFINLTEPLASGSALFDFDFFRFSTVILLPTAVPPKVLMLPRTYQYNNYFLDLISSFDLGKVLPDLNP